jgi:hypothetical protein
MRIQAGWNFRKGQGMAIAAIFADIALNELRMVWHCPPETGRQIVEDNDIFPRIEQCKNHVAADESPPLR